MLRSRSRGPKRSTGKKGLRSASQLYLMLQTTDMPCTFGRPNVHAGTAGLRPEKLRQLRELGEVGQLIMGLRYGYSLAEIASKREWDDETTLAVLNEAKQLVLGDSK